jgi:hypothetical protein
VNVLKIMEKPQPAFSRIKTTLATKCQKFVCISAWDESGKTGLPNI